MLYLYLTNKIKIMQSYKIKVKGHSYGRIQTITHVFTTDIDFKDEVITEIPLEIKNGVILNKHILNNPITISSTCKLMDHLDDTNFGRQMMNEYDFDFILDYWLHVPKPRKTKAQKQELLIHIETTVMDILSRLGMKQETLELFMHAYSKMKDEIIHLTAHEQISIVFKACGIGIDAAKTAYEHMSNYGKSLSTMSLEELNNHKTEKNNLKLN